MPAIFERTPETEKAMSYGYLDLFKEVLSGVSQRRKEASQRLLEGRPTDEDLLEMMFAGVGGVIKKLPFVTVGGLRKLQKLEKVKNSLPISLRKYATDEETAERLFNLGGMKKFMRKVAPETGNVNEFYRPAIRMKGDKILWHPKALIHSEVLTKKFKGIKHFDYSSVKGQGGIGPDGFYYEDSFGGDALVDLWFDGVKDISGSWKP